MKRSKLGLLIILIISAILIGIYFIGKSQENKGKQTAISIKPLASVKVPMSSFDFDEKNNLTKTLGQDLIGKIRSANLSNQEKNNPPIDVNLMSGQLANEVIKNSLSNFDIVSTIDDSELKISQNTSKKAKSQYLKAIGEASQKNFANFDKNYLGVIVDTYQKIDPSSAKRLADIYENLADDYLNLEAPADWVNFHKRIIIYAKNAKLVYQAMANYPSDPIKGYLAIEMIDTLVNNAEQIQNIFMEKTNEIKS